VFFERIRVITGSGNSKFPACTSLFLDGGDVAAVLDTGAGPDALVKAKAERRVDIVVNTHYHFDHICGNYLFPDAVFYLNQLEVKCFADLSQVGNWLGIREIYGNKGVEAWLEKVATPGYSQCSYTPAHRHEWWMSSRVPAIAYDYDQDWQIGNVRVRMIHAPGHTRGFCCPFFPDEGLVYTGDIDLTDFGPWYFGSDGNIKDFIASAHRIAQLDVAWFLTGHQVGMCSRTHFLLKLDEYLAKIYKRQERLLDLLNSGISPEEIPAHGLLYPPKFQSDPWIAMWERIGVRKHLEWLREEQPRNVDGGLLVRPMLNGSMESV